jgi:cytochrome b involved in lipid metabolism
MKLYTASEVAKHCTEASLWVIVSQNDVKKVLDLTEFAERHPGGIEALLEVAGKDATERILEVHPHVLNNVDEVCIGLLDAPQC